MTPEKLIINKDSRKRTAHHPTVIVSILVEGIQIAVAIVDADRPVTNDNIVVDVTPEAA